MKVLFNAGWHSPVLIETHVKMQPAFFCVA